MELGRTGSVPETAHDHFIFTSAFKGLKLNNFDKGLGAKKNLPLVTTEFSLEFAKSCRPKNFIPGFISEWSFDFGK
jgi:hypothetical protein